MRNLSSADSRDPTSVFRGPASSSPDSLQMSYCLVSEEEMDASINQRPQSQRYASPHRSKRSPPTSHAKPPSSPKNDPESFADSPHTTSPDSRVLRRESTQTVKPDSSGFAAPPSSSIRRSSPAMTPSVPDTISDLSCSASRHDSPVASFSEAPLSRVPSVPDCNAAYESTGQYSVYSEQELVMPVLTVPHRRLFTETGKSIGRLKILVAGRKGTGKSSLIRAILQCCEHIVHVEPKKDAPSTVRADHGHCEPTARTRGPRISEIHASTMPRPAWWGPCDGEGADESQDPSFVDTGLDSNICFVDTLGHDASKLSDVISLSHDYIESHLRPHLSSTIEDSDMLRMLGGSGGSLVSAVLYLIPPSGITKEDTQFFSALQQVTNVIPVVSHADTLSVTEVAAIKEAVTEELAENNVRPFTFSVSGSPDDTPPVYAVSTLPGAEYDVTDASLLVNSEYLQPLVTTDLARLVDDIFCANGASWLRHSAAKVYLNWRRRHVQFGYGMDLCLAPKLAVAGFPPASFPWGDARSNEILLNDWATALRRSLDNSTCNWRSSELVQVTRPADLAIVRRHEKRRKAEVVAHQDPLGLLRILGGVKNHGQAVTEIAATLGVMGTFGFYMWKVMGPE